MSRIAGTIFLKNDEATRDEMLKAMHHAPVKYPGVYVQNNCLLLHRPISKSCTAQPFSVDRAGERYVIIFDGE